MKRIFAASASSATAFFVASHAMAQDSTEDLKKQLAEQQAKIEAQQQQLEQQAALLRTLSEKLDAYVENQEMPHEAAPASSGKQVAATGASPPPERTEQAVTREAVADTRDSVGDLNAEAVRAGTFPGSFRIPGPGAVSLRIGGFVKTVAIADSDAEASGTIFTPALLGARRSDTDGNYSIDATLSRVFIDGRAPVGDGLIRGYVEWDFNGSGTGSPAFNTRLAYGSWQSSAGTLLVGHYWSTMMDLRILPEGLTEPTVSGVIFSRQSQVRWTQPLGRSLTMNVAIEDPTNTDVEDYSANPELSVPQLPDGVMRFDLAPSDRWHLSLSGLLRDLRVELPTGKKHSELGWGLQLSGHISVASRDKFGFNGVYGEGLGRYMLGIQPTAGAVIDPATDTLVLRKNWGMFGTYQHFWSEKLRSTFTAGYAKSETLDWQPASTFSNSTFASVNLMWQILPYLTFGAEYGYGSRENKDGSDLDNHRFSLGFQFY